MGFCFVHQKRREGVLLNFANALEAKTTLNALFDATTNSCLWSPARMNTAGKGGFPTTASTKIHNPLQSGLAMVDASCIQMSIQTAALLAE